MLHVDAPAAVQGDRLHDELVAAGLPVEEPPQLVGPRLRLVDLDESHRADVEAVVAAHDPPAPQPSPGEQRREAIRGASNLAQLKAALIDHDRG